MYIYVKSPHFAKLTSPQIDMSHYLTFLATLLLACQATAETFKQDAVLNERVWLLKEMEICKHVTVTSMNSIALVSLENFNNEGTFCVRRDEQFQDFWVKDLSGDLRIVTPNLFLNSGKFIFDGRFGASSPQVKLYSHKDFINDGIMLFGASGEMIPENLPVFAFGAARRWKNNGMITLEKFDGAAAPANFVRIDKVRPARVENRGSICLVNVDYSLTEEVKGDGCIVVDNSATLTVTPDFLLQQQTIY